MAPSGSPHVIAGSIRVRGDALKAEAFSIGREHLLQDLGDIFIRSEGNLVQRSSYTLCRRASHPVAADAPDSGFPDPWFRLFSDDPLRYSDEPSSLYSRFSRTMTTSSQDRGRPDRDLNHRRSRTRARSMLTPEHLALIAHEVCQAMNDSVQQT
jgi:hypothetical protein